MEIFDIRKELYINLIQWTLDVLEGFPDLKSICMHFRITIIDGKSFVVKQQWIASISLLSISAIIPITVTVRNKQAFKTYLVKAVKVVKVNYY